MFWKRLTTIECLCDNTQAVPKVMVQTELSDRAAYATGAFCKDSKSHYFVALSQVSQEN